MVAGVLLFILYPLLCMIRQSFIGENGFSTEVYKSIFSNNLLLVKNSVFVGVLSAFFSTIFGLFVAICVWTAGKKLGKFLECILLISMVSPPFIASLAYIQLFGRNGLITKGKYETRGISFQIAAVVAAVVIKVVGYYIAEVIIYHNLFAPVASIPGNLVQIGTAAVIVLICVEQLRKVLRPILK